ncbi:hypothetical protein BHE74_00050548 [Ensete ventricosum]|nr:hypothetical protein BHE74_00050548 [Ensete ventricosum]
MVHYRPKSPTSAYKIYLYLQAKIGHKSNQTRAGKPTASPLLAVQEEGEEEEKNTSCAALHRFPRAVRRPRVVRVICRPRAITSPHVGRPAQFVARNRYPFMEAEARDLRLEDVQQLLGLYRQVVTKYRMLSEALRQLSVDENQLLHVLNNHQCQDVKEKIKQQLEQGKNGSKHICFFLSFFLSFPGRLRMVSVVYCSWKQWRHKVNGIRLGTLRIYEFCRMDGHGIVDDP